MFCRLKDFRRIATGCDQLATNYLTLPSATGYESRFSNLNGSPAEMHEQFRQHGVSVVQSTGP